MLLKQRHLPGRSEIDLALVMLMSFSFFFFLACRNSKLTQILKDSLGKGIWLLLNNILKSLLKFDCLRELMDL